MIRINLLGVERPKARRAPVFDSARRVTIASSLVLLVGAGGIGWWFWSLRTEAAQVEAELASATQESARLRSILTEVQQFEQRRQQLQQRVALIEQLRRGQSIPVQLLDRVSRSLPDMLWLTAMSQKGSDIIVEGRSTTLIALSDFIGNLGATDFFKKPIEIVDSQVEPAPKGAAAGADVIRFTVKAALATAPTAAPARN